MSILVRRRQRFSGHKQSREAKPMKGQIIFHAQLKSALTIRSHCKLQMHLVCIIEHSIGKCSRNQRLWIMIKNEKKNCCKASFKLDVNGLFSQSVKSNKEVSRLKATFSGGSTLCIKGSHTFQDMKGILGPQFFFNQFLSFQLATICKPCKKSLLTRREQHCKYFASQGILMSEFHTPCSMSYLSTIFLCSKSTLDPPTPPKT